MTVRRSCRRPTLGCCSSTTSTCCCQAFILARRRHSDDPARGSPASTAPRWRRTWPRSRLRSTRPSSPWSGHSNGEDVSGPGGAGGSARTEAVRYAASPQWASVTTVSACCPRRNDLRPATGSTRRTSSSGCASSAAPSASGCACRTSPGWSTMMDRGHCPCGHTEALLRARLAAVDEEIAGLTGLRDELARLLDAHPATACPDDGAGTWWCRNDFAGRR